MEQQNKLRPLALLLTILTGMARLFPHPPNFTPVGAMSLFAGARLPGWQAYLAPLGMMLMTDPLLQLLFGVPAFSRTSVFIYLSFLINVWIGRRLRQSQNPIHIGSAAFLCSLQFFLITNFGLWAVTSYYPHTLAGLSECFLAALPFFGRTLAGDLVFTAILFGAHAWLSRRISISERVEVNEPHCLPNR